ncbi:NTP transferase domain-containing protein [Nitriliruptoraceae bacterium ZYF776]|nr:NTP transferase domain-containing protein [Profundirhabdus halotolerans]
MIGRGWDTQELRSRCAEATGRRRPRSPGRAGALAPARTPDDDALDEERRVVTVGGVVLAGGGSRRFGGDKRRHLVDGVPMLRRAVDAATSVATDVVVAVSPAHPLPGDVALPPGVRVVVDEVPDAGPLGGLAVGLGAVDAEVVVVVGADHPFVAPATLEALVAAVARSRDLDAAIVVVDGRRQPLLGAYRRDAGAIARRLLAAGERRALALLDHLAVVELTDAPGARAAAHDVDTPDDLDPRGAHDVLGNLDAPDVGTAYGRQVGHVRVVAVAPDGVREVDDVTAGEEPLRIRISGPGQQPLDVSTTMRTPGTEVELAVGLLHAEGLLRAGEVVRTSTGDLLTDARPDDTVTIHVRDRVDPSTLVDRHLPATASCGVCGRASVDDLLARVTPLEPAAGPRVPWTVLAALPDRLRAHQRAFDATGGLHATGIADTDGRLVTVREDVGRHNALDAALGTHVLAGTVPLTDHVVVLSGRVGFELVQKVAVAGVPIVVAVGAPSDLAVRTAAAVGVTLVAFVRRGRGNVYTHPDRVVLPSG